MPTQTKTKAPRVKSPVAAAAYAWLARPDEGQQYSDGKYKVTLLLDKDDKDVKTWIKKLEATSDEVATEHFNGKPKSSTIAGKMATLSRKRKTKRSLLVSGFLLLRPNSGQVWSTVVHHPLHSPKAKSQLAVILFG